MRRKYTVYRSNKYANLKYNKFLASTYRTIFIGGVVVTVFGSILFNKTMSVDDAPEIIEVTAIPINYEDLHDKMEVVEDTYQQALIREYCAVYQVDYDIVYGKLCELTNNFTSEAYFNGTIPGITFKGSEVQFNNEEALLLAGVRCCEQTPRQVNLSDIKTKVKYETNLSYVQQIKKYADIFDVDECMMLAVIQSETGFGSNLSRQNNNLANLKGSDGFMVFDNETQSIIELATELRKLNDLGKYTVEEIGDVYAPLDDNNEHWVSNVTKIRDNAMVNYEEIFGVPVDGIHLN